MWQVLAGYSFGIFSIIRFESVPNLNGLGFLTFGLITLTVIGYRMFPRSRIFSGLLFVAAVSIGALYGSWYSMSRYQGWLPETLNGQDMVVTGVVDNLPRGRHGKTRFYFVGSSDEKNLSGRLSLSWHDAPELSPGQQWSLCVRLKRPHGFAGPSVQDYEAVLLRQGVVATGYVKDCPEHTNVLLSEIGSPLMERWRQELSLWLGHHLEGSGVGLVRGLLLGDSRGIDPDDWQVFRDTGTVHLLVISGLHISLMALVGWLLVRLLALAGVLPLSLIPAPKIAIVFSLLLACGYGVLAGVGLPVQRALVMLLVGGGCLLLGFRLPLLTVYLLALSAVLTFEPLAITARGFWLSFLAVAVLLYAFSHRQGDRFWLRFMRTQFVVCIGLVPLLAQMQQPVSLLSPLVNLISIPLIGSMLVPVMLVGLGVSAVLPTLGLSVLQVCSDCLWWWQQALMEICGLGHHLFELPVPGDCWVLVSAMLGVVLLLSPAALGWRWLSVFCFLPWLWPADQRPVHGEALLVVHDVGQGLAVTVQTRSHMFVYDTGDRFSPSFSAAQAVLIPYLQQVRQAPDRILISHGDRDHIGGLESLSQRYPLAHIDSPENLPEDYCPAGEGWMWDGVSFHVLGAGQGGFPHYSANDASCVVQVCARDECVLLTGDITRRREKQLVNAYGDKLYSRILVAPHHGSQTSSSDEFLDVVQPEIVSVSAGYVSRFGHPSPTVVKRLQERGIAVLNTAVTGSQTMTLGRKAKPLCQRGHEPWWRR